MLEPHIFHSTRPMTIIRTRKDDEKTMKKTREMTQMKMKTTHKVRTHMHSVRAK